MNASRAGTEPVTILLSALGGEGGGVLADWLVDTARNQGHAVQGTSIPGVAQRTGATTYYVEVFPLPDRALAGRRPVFGLYAVPGGLDLLVGSELLEATRQAALGLVSPERTAVVVSSSRSLTVLEKMGLGDGRLPEAGLRQALGQAAQALEVLDMAAIAAAQGCVISAVMFGALAGWCGRSGLLPFPRAAYEDAIRRSGKGVAASLRGFGAAYEQVLGPAGMAAAAAPALTGAVTRSAGPATTARPGSLDELTALGEARLRDYQDDAYAALYRERLQRITTAERTADGADAACPASAEVARWLALWMTFDDIVRVADLKSRASRWRRVRGEVQATPGELLRVWDHFKPGVAEFAALLPAGLAARLQRWDARRVAAGREPWALPLAIGSHTVTGLVALRVLAACRGLRRLGSRYATEQALMARWLAAVQAGLADSAALGLEIARCGRLIKGYGSTNERGKHHLLHITDHLARGAAPPAQRAAAIAAAREAALADERGDQLDRTLAAHGAPPRPVPAVPIRWHRRTPAARRAPARH